jgi:hypothetical protein
VIVPALRRAALSAVALTLLLPAVAPAAEPGITPMGHIAGKAVPEASAMADALQNAPAGRKWARLFFDWNQTEHTDDGPYDQGTLSSFDARIAALRNAGIKVAITVQSPPAWAPTINSDAGAAKYAEFMADLATRWKGKVAVWELWNEPDDNLFWPDGPKSDRYATLLKKTTPLIRAADPAATVIVGGLVGNDFEFVEQLYDHGAGPYFDGVGLHTDTSCRIDPPNVFYREPSGRIGRYAFTGYREVHATLAAHGDAHKQLYMTEIGWTDAADIRCTDGRDRSNGVTAEKQAQYLKEAYACFAADPYVKMASWYTLQDHVATNRYGLYDVNGNKRPALAAMKAVGDGTGAGVDRSCGGVVDRDKPVVTLNTPSTFFNDITLSGTVTDASTKIWKVELWVDGKKVRGGLSKPNYSLDWARAKELAFGAHTVQVRAWDEARNMGLAEATVTRTNPATVARVAAPQVTFDAKAIGRRFRVSASVRPAADGSVTEVPAGRVTIAMQRRGKRGWTKPMRVRYPLNKDGRIKTYTSRPRKAGTWRVFGIVDVQAPYRRVRTAPVVLKLR